jgi:hypothetical protein
MKRAKSIILIAFFFFGCEIYDDLQFQRNGKVAEDLTIFFSAVTAGDDLRPLLGSELAAEQAASYFPDKIQEIKLLWNEKFPFNVSHHDVVRDSVRVKGGATADGYAIVLIQNMKRDTVFFQIELSYHGFDKPYKIKEMYFDLAP